LLRDIISIDHDTKLESMLKEFKKGKSHMAVVSKKSELGTKIFLGILTLEDVIEALLQEEVEDEADLEKEEMTMGRGKEIKYFKQ